MRPFFSGLDLLGGGPAYCLSSDSGSCLLDDLASSLRLHRRIDGLSDALLGSGGHCPSGPGPENLLRSHSGHHGLPGSACALLGRRLEGCDCRFATHLGIDEGGHCGNRALLQGRSSLVHHIKFDGVQVAGLGNPDGLLIGVR